MCIPIKTEGEGGKQRHFYSDVAMAAKAALDARARALGEATDIKSRKYNLDRALKERNEETLANLVKEDPDEIGAQALLKCAAMGWPEGVAIAVRAGADLRCAPAAGQTSPAHQAARNGHAAVLRLLLSLEAEAADGARVVPEDGADGAKTKPDKAVAAMAARVETAKARVEKTEKAIDAQRETIEAARMTMEDRRSRRAWQKAAEPAGKPLSGKAKREQEKADQNFERRLAESKLVILKAEKSMYDLTQQLPAQKKLAKEAALIAAAEAAEKAPAAKKSSGADALPCVLWEDAARGGTQTGVLLGSRDGKHLVRVDDRGDVEVPGAAATKVPCAAGLAVKTKFGKGVAASVDAHASTVSLHWGATLKAPHAARTVTCPHAIALARSTIVTARTNKGETPLHSAAANPNGAEAIATLVDAGVPVDAMTNDRSTPLHYACRRGAKASVAALLARGADPFATNTRDETPGACFPPGAETAKAVLDAHVRAREVAADAAARDLFDTSAVRGRDAAALRDAVSRDPEKFGSLAVLMCAEMGWAEGLEVALGARSDGWRPLETFDETLHGALVKVNPDRNDFQRLCERQAPGAVEAFGWCDGMESMCGRVFAVETVHDSTCGYRLVVEAAQHRLEESAFAVPFDACMLVSRDTSPGIRATLRCETASGSGPLHQAARYGNIDTLEALLRLGEPANPRNRHRRTPLHLAAEKGYAKVVARLADAGSGPGATAADGSSALHYACRRANLGCVEELLGRGVDPLVRDSMGLTPVHYATRQGHIETLKTILRHTKSAADARDFKNLTPLHVAADEGCAGALEVLLDAGADVDALDADSWTALHYACRSFDKDCVEVLLERGAAPSVCNRHKKPPAFYLPKKAKVEELNSRVAKNEKAIEGQRETIEAAQMNSEERWARRAWKKAAEAASGKKKKKKKAAAFDHKMFEAQLAANKREIVKAEGKVTDLKDELAAQKAEIADAAAIAGPVTKAREVLEAATAAKGALDAEAEAAAGESKFDSGNFSFHGPEKKKSQPSNKAKSVNSIPIGARVQARWAGKWFDATVKAHRGVGVYVVDWLETPIVGDSVATNVRPAADVRAPPGSEEKIDDVQGETESKADGPAPAAAPAPAPEVAPKVERVVAASLTEDRVIAKEKTERGLPPVLCRALVPEAALTIKNSDVSTRATYAAKVSAAVAQDDASKALKTVCEAFAIPGFQGIHARDALKWLRTALKRQRPTLVQVLLEVELIDDGEEGGTADERERRLRTNVVSGALKCAIREDNLLKKTWDGLRCAQIVVDMEASRACVRLTDLRCVLESMLAAEKSGAVFFEKPHEVGSSVSSTIIPKSEIVDQLYNLFHGLLAAYDDGAALEAYALTGTKPLLSEVLDRSDAPAAMQTKVVVAIAHRLAALGSASLSVEDRPAPHGLSLAHVIVARGIEDTIKSLVVGGHVPSDDYGRTPLSLAIQLRRNASVVKAVAKGATVAHLEAVDAFGSTPLHHAARGGAAAVCKALLAELPPHLVDAKNLAGESALLVAATSSSPHRVAVCQLLLENGATLDRGAAFQLLADPEHVKRPGWEAIEPKLLQAPHDGLPIHALVAADRVDAVRQRAKVAAEAVVRAHHYARHVEAAGGRDLGLTALHLARSGEMARLLLDADPDAWRRRTKSGDTPLHRACARDDAEVVSELLRRGAKWGRAFENRDGQTAYQLATGESKTLIKAAIAAREQERRRREEEALKKRRATTDWLAVAEEVDAPDKLALIRDSVAKLSPPQSASDDAIDVPERVDGAAVPTRSSSPRPEGTAFAPELPVFLTPDALTQLFQMDGQSRRRAITMIESIPAGAAPPGAIRVDKSLEVYLSSDRSVVFEFAYDYVDGGRSHTRVLRVYSMDEREQEATKVLLTRIGKLHRAGRASPLAYKLSKEPGKGQKYYKLPDPISVTGVMKCYRLTRKLIDIATSGQFLEPSRGVRSDFELDHVEIEEVTRWSRDPTPTLLLGRGGTGKTLIILQSLWRKYQLAVEEGGGGVVVFVTGSNVLRNSVREAFMSLRHAYHGIVPNDAPPASLLREDLGTSDGRPSVIFYTTKELLAAIDASCTRSLLSGDQRAEAATSLEESLRKHATAEVTTEATTEVTDAHFTRWWQRGLGRGVRADPGVVWSEILTHIKGSPRVSARGKPLSREEYLALPRKTAPAFAGLGSAGSEKWGSRDAVYDCFERYEAEKAKLVGAYDICDLVTSCMTQVVDGESYEGVKLSGLICDEVQDFTLSTVVLLLNLLEDEDQFMCGGDTAQTICKVTFNFKDLGVVLNRRRDRATKRLEAHWAAAPADRGPIAPAVPRESQLRVLRTNYRCHQGVLSVANLCVEMMQLFPNSVDAIEPERAHFAGAAPLLFLDDDFNDVADVFSGGHTASDFGANQVIIVRDEAAKRALPAQLAGALVMTPLEAKGLEFADVVAYNFFKDSVAPDRAWGACAHEIGCPGDAAAAFDARTHLVLSDELKQLYVACTRARERLVFFDQSATARKAFFDALLHRRIGRAHDGVFSRTDGSVALARASEAREWRSRGTQFLKRAEDGDYERASECFSKSGDEPRRLLCIGLKTLSQARATDDRAKALTAAYLLARSECEGSEVPLAEALEECGEHGVAAAAWRRLGRESDAFRASREHLRATDPEAHAAWKADADAAARAALAAKQAAVRRARQAARKKPRAPAEPVIGRPRAAPTETRSVARRLLDEKIKKAAAAPPRRTDASSEAAAPPSIATQTSKATSAATSAIAVAPSAHAQERMVEREIARRDLQEAKKFGARRSMQGGRVSYEFRGLKYIEAPGRSAVGVTAFYKSVPDGCCERAFVAYGGAKKPSRRDVDRLVQGILRDRGAEVHVSEHSERGEWGYLVAARSSEATDEVADGLRKLVSAGRAARPTTELPPVREDAAVEAPFPPPPAESIAAAAFPPLPGSGQPAAELLAAQRLDLVAEVRRERDAVLDAALEMEAARREFETKYATAQDELKRMAQTLATTKMQLERAQKARVESEAARDDLREARDDLEVELATTTQRMNSALAAVAQRDKVIEERERELRELRAQLVAPQAVPSRSAERGVGSPPNEAPRGKKSRKAKTAPPRDIVSFLNKANLAKYRGIFEKEEITLDTLPDLDDETLAELGLSKKERQRFVAARASL
jgi:ankyrin repeat protein